MNNKIVLYPTDTSQWYALVNDAQSNCNRHLDEEVESYLVFLLMRFVSRPEIARSLLAMDFLTSQNETGQVRAAKLRDLGDKSLLFSGLFPGFAQRKRVDIDYFKDMGQSAYAVLARLENRASADLFASLCVDFEALVTILQTMRCESDELLHQLNMNPEQLRNCFNDSIIWLRNIALKH